MKKQLALAGMDHTYGKWGSSNCQVHKTHAPKVHGTQVHHVQPMGMGGQDVSANRVETCPNGHTNIHILLALLVKQKGVLKPEQTLGYAREERRLARLGYDRWVAAGKPVRGGTE